MDITKCGGIGDERVCPKRGRCRRYVIESGEMQSWFAPAPLKADGSCDHFIEAIPEDYWQDYRGERG